MPLYNPVSGQYLISGGTQRFSVDATGNFVPFVDNAYDIGDASHRPRHLFLSGSINMTSTSSSAGIAITNAASTILNLGASTTAKSALRIAPTGVAPSAPVNGDIWFDGTDIKMRIGGVTKTFTLT